MRTLTSVTGTLAAGAGGALAYATMVEPYLLETVMVQVHLPRLPKEFEGYTVLQLSDLHMSRLGRRERALLRMLAGMAPADLVAFTGDLVYTSRGIEPFLQIAKAARARDGKFAVFGNSEHKNGVRGHVFAERLAEAGITPLLNKHARVDRDGASLYVVGVDDPVSEHDDLPAALEGVPECAAQVLLMHTPDSVGLAVAQGVDLVLSGHTHGGQIKVPLLGALYTHSRLGRHMAHGHYEGKRLRNLIGFRPGRTQLYVTRGIGVSGLSLRFLCRPEITLLTLRSGPAPARRHR